MKDYLIKIKLYINNHKEITIIFAVFSIVYLFGLEHLRFVRDDWSNLNNLNQLYLKYGFWDSTLNLIANKWISISDLRIFFVSFWILFIWLIIFSFNYVPFYLLILGLHFICTIIILKILKKITKSNFLALTASLIFLLIPTSTNVLFWLNNCFFCIPVFFLLLFLFFYFFPRKNKFLNYFLLTILIFLSQFSGEQIIPLLYTFCLLLLIKSYINKTIKKQFLITVLPFIINFLILIVYITIFKKSNNQFNLNFKFNFFTIIQYYLDLGKNFALYFYFYSMKYGHGTIIPSFSTIIQWILASFLLYLGLFLNTKNYLYVTGSKKTFWLIISLIILFISSTLTLIFGALQGIRRNVESRYVYLPGLIISLLICLFLFYIIKNKSIFKILCFLLLSYFSFLSIYSINDVWGTQKKIDHLIWKQIEQKIDNNTKYLFVNNNKTPQLMPQNYSDAISDFQADWGVVRLKITNNQNIKTVSQIIENKNDILQLQTMFGKEYSATKNQVIFVNYSFGEKFNDLLTADLNIFNKYENYLNFIKQNSL